MEKVKEIWSYVWSKLVAFGKLLKKWFTEDEVVVPEVTKPVEEKKETKIRLRKKNKKVSKSKK